MSNKDLPENENQKIRFERGNQITTYDKEPTIWIEISENELPEGISNQDILRVFEYRLNNQGQSNTVTVIEESTIQEINTKTNAAQTEYLIDKHKYSKEAIKPYFLSYLDSEEKLSDEIVDLKSDKRSVSLSEELDQFNDSTESSVSKVDAETEITPKSTSSTQLQFVKPITDQARLNASKILAGTLLKPLPREESRVIKAYTLACDNLISSENQDLKKVDNCNIKSSAGNCAEFIQNLVFDQVHCKESTKENMSEDRQKVPDVRNLVFDRARCEESNNNNDTPEDSQQQQDGPEPISCIPENCCHHNEEQRRKPCDDDADEVQIMCRKGDVKFKLRCRRIEGSTRNCDKVGNEIRYECQVVPEKNQCIDKSILESCDLKCSLVSAPPVMSAIPHNIKNEPTCPTCNAPLPPENTPKPTSPDPKDSKPPPPPPPPVSSAPPPPPPTPSSHTSKKNCSSPRTSNTKPAPNNIENENNNPIIKVMIKPNCGTTQKDTSEDTINADMNSKGTPHDNTGTVDVRTLDKCENISEKLVFACRSKSKIKDCEELPPPPPPKEVVKTGCNQEVNKTESKCGPGMFDDIKTAMTDAHCKTMATIRVAAEDLLCSVGKTIGNSKRICEDPCSITKVKDSAEDLICKLQKTAEEAEISQKVECFMENSCKTIKKIQKCTRDAVKGATNQTKRALGYQVEETDDEEDREIRCKTKLPCPNTKIKKISCSNDDSDSLSEAVRESVEKFYDDVCKSSQEAKDAVADLASQSLKILGLEDDQPSFRGLVKSEEETPISKVKKSAEELVYEVQKKTQELKNLSAEDRIKMMRESAENIIEKISKTTEKIAECTQDACNEIASKSKKILGYHQESELSKKKENIKNVISGLTLFQEASDTKDGKQKEEEKPGVLNSTLNSIKASFEGLGSIELGERSSPYDRPTPPREVALMPSNNISRVSGMFSNIKDRFFSMFYENNLSETQSFSSASLTEDEILSVNTTTSNKRKPSDASIESTDFFNRLAD